MITEATAQRIAVALERILEYLAHPLVVIDTSGNVVPLRNPIYGHPTDLSPRDAEEEGR